MSDIAALVSDHLDIWTAATERKNGAGRGGGKRISLYGIERLRTLILDLAVLGRLVPQDEGDESATVLLKATAAARLAAVQSGKARKPKPTNELPNDLPELPRGWCWTQLSELAEISPSNASDDNVEASFVPMALVTSSIAGEHDFEVRKWGEIKKGFTHFADGDVALAKITPCFENGKAAILQDLRNGIGAGTTELHVARPWLPELNRRFLLLTMKTGTYLRNGEAKMTGTAGQKRITRSYFEATPLPLPPLAEQGRIVAKVDELMALCDALEGESAAALAAHQTLVETLLARLVNSADAADLAANWTRLEAHFDTLFTTEASVEALKQTVLELAVRGRLTRPEHEDGQVEQLLTDIAEHRKLKVKQGRRRAPDVPARAVNGAELPFVIPEHWQFARFQDVLINRDAERIPVSSGERVGRKGEYDYYGASGVIDKIDRFLFEEPLLLIGEDGANLINRSTPIAFVARGKYWVNNHAHVLEACSETLLRYMEIFINAIDLKPYVTGTAQPKMNQAKMNSIIVALAPADEMKRVVAKVDALMILCDDLKARITDAGQIQMRLADAIVERAAA
ncbi:MAG: restriction endonuclease subunit S [Sphingomonas paucimobilis]